MNITRMCGKEWNKKRHLMLALHKIRDFISHIMIFWFCLSHLNKTRRMFPIWSSDFPWKRRACAVLICLADIRARTWAGRLYAKIPPEATRKRNFKQQSHRLIGKFHNICNGIYLETLNYIVLHIHDVR